MAYFYRLAVKTKNFKIDTAGSLGAEALKCALYITHNKTFFEIVQK